MNTPNGWTPEEIKKRSTIAKCLMKKGYTEAQAVAIATSQILKKRRLNHA